MLYFHFGDCASRSQEFWQDLPICDKVFKQLEDHEMTVDCLASTKIGKVMRHIMDNGEIPSRGEFRFQERAWALFEQWSQFSIARHDDSTKCRGYLDSGDMSADLPIIHDILRVRGRHVGGGDGLKEVIVAHASGRTTSVTLPSS